MADRIDVRRPARSRAHDPGTAETREDRTREYPSLTQLDGPPAQIPASEEPPRDGGDHSRYSLVRMHAEGGIGQIWAAHDRDFDREVALKRLRPAGATTASARARFLREAQITGRLQHPGIVPVYELGRAGTGSDAFYTMRFIRGRHPLLRGHPRLSREIVVRGPGGAVRLSFASELLTKQLA